MKKYIIRKIGWIFDDDWYNIDSEYDVEAVFVSKEEAHEKMRQLNYLYFLFYLPYLSKYQLNFLYGYKDQKEEFVNFEKIEIVLANKLNLKREELFEKYYRGVKNDKLHLLKNISAIEVEELLKSLNLRFFTFIEMNAEEMFLYHFKRNPVLWSPYFDKDYYSQEDNYYYFLDNRDEANRRTANTIIECYELALNKDDYDYSFERQLFNEILVEGKLSDISETPIVLESIIRNSEFINYDAEYEYLEFKKGISANELMALDSVLINPIIIVEKVSINSLRRSNNDFIKRSVEKDLGIEIIL